MHEMNATLFMGTKMIYRVLLHTDTNIEPVSYRVEFSESRANF